MSSLSPRVQSWLGINCGIARFRYQIKAALNHDYFKQCLLCRAVRLAFLAAVVLTILVAHSAGVWKVKVEYDLSGIPFAGSDRISRDAHVTGTETAERADDDTDADGRRNVAWKANTTDVLPDSAVGKPLPPFRVIKLKSAATWEKAAPAASKQEQDDVKNDPLIKDVLKSTHSNSSVIPTAKPTPQDSNLQKAVPINCAKLIANDSAEMKRAADYQRANPKVIIPEVHYINATENCVKFKQERRYITEPLSAEEAAFPLAFSMLIYKDIEQFERLLRTIYRPQNYYCVHVDSTSNAAVKKAAQGIASCFENVFLSSQSYDVRWGTYTIIEPEFQCMEDLWSKPSWKYFINLTGQEFPLQTIWDIVKILQVYNGANNMEGTVKRRNPHRAEYVYDGLAKTEVKLDPCPVNATITKGSVHITASRAYVDYILHDERGLKFRDWVKNTGVPDETFFSSLNFSPQLQVPGAYTGEPETDTESNLFITRYKNWGAYPFTGECHGRWSQSICIHGVGDLPNLASRRELFTNKFYLEYQPLALDCLEESILNRTRNQVLENRNDLDVSFYKELDFVKNHI